MDHSKSQAAFAEAKQYIPGGVNSPVRSFRSIGGVPPVIAKGSGSKLTDIDGNEYIDYVLSYGPLLLGHAHPQVTESIQTAAAKGSSYARRPWLKQSLPNFSAHLYLLWNGTYGQQRNRSYHECSAFSTRLYRT